MESDTLSIAAVLPCYRVGHKILAVLARIGPEVTHIYVVDDACPDGSGALVEQHCTDARVQVIKRAENGGVGAACCSGFAAAIADQARSRHMATPIAPPMHSVARPFFAPERPISNSRVFRMRAPLAPIG